jgi:hypothetical protein
MRSRRRPTAAAQTLQTIARALVLILKTVGIDAGHQAQGGNHHPVTTLDTKDAILLQGVADRPHLLGVTTGLVVVVQNRRWVADGTSVGVLLVASRTERIRPHLRVDVIVVGTESIAKDTEVIVQIAGGDGVRRHG